MNKLFTKTARRHLTHWFACLTILAFPAIAQAFVIDSLEYKVTDEAKNEVALTAYAIGLSGDVTIPAEVEYEGVKYKVTSIGEYAFQYCIGLKTIDIPNSISSIGKYAFENCEGLETINISPSSPIKRIEDNTFNLCTSLTSITIPDSVTYIGSYALSSCEKLTEITVPNSVTFIDQFAFAYCGNLTSITLPNTINTLSLCLLEGCKSLSTFKIPDSVESIAAGVFDYCEGLTRIVIPDSVKLIGQRAFFQCTNLSYVYIPKSVSTIQEGAFEGCPKLEDPEHPENAIYCEVEEEPEDWILFYGYEFQGLGRKLSLNVVWASAGTLGQTFVIDNLKYTITDDVKNGVSVSANSTELSGNVTIPAEVEYEGVKYTVTSIAKEGFQECAELTSIDIPNTVTAIGPNAFYGCDKLADNKYPKQAIYCNMKENEKPEGWDETWNYYKYDGTLCNTYWMEEASLPTDGSTDLAKIYESEGAIIVENFTGDISVFNPAGQLILRRTVTDPYTEITVKAGFYMVTAGETSGRVIVR